MNETRLKLFFKQYWILLTLVAIKFILQFALINPIYELHRDEFLYLDQAFHPAAGYISVPPFTSWMSRFIFIMGGGLFWIRFVPALFGAATIVFSWLIVEELGGKLPSKILTSILLIFSVYTRLNVLFQPNSFDILSWTIIFYFLIKYMRNHHLKWLYLAAFIAALGLYNKYTVVFLIIGLSIGLLLTPQRIVFTKKAFYYAIGLLVLLILPNIIWQITNHFPVIHHMRELQENQLVNVNRMDFLFDQVKNGLILIPTIAAFWALMFYKPFKPYRFVLWTYLIIMILFTMSRAKSYYALGLYPVLFAFGSVYLEILNNKWKTILFSFLVVTHIVAFFLIVKYLMPFQNPSEIIADKEAYKKIGLLRWEDGLNHSIPQDFADMLGWEELAKKVDSVYKKMPNATQTLVLCDNYGQAGAINYYSKQHIKAVSFNADYVNWFILNTKYINLIRVKNYEEKDNEFTKTSPYFEISMLADSITNPNAREFKTRIFAFTGAKVDINKRIQKEIEAVKNDY